MQLLFIVNFYAIGKLFHKNTDKWYGAFRNKYLLLETILVEFIVVGTSHAGYEAIQTLLKEQPDAELYLYERGDTASFLSCGIQNYLEGIAESLDSLHYATESSYIEQNVNVHMNSDVVGLNPKAKTITVKTTDGETEESYDKLILSPVVAPVRIPIPGADLNNIFYVRGYN